MTEPNTKREMKIWTGWEIYHEPVKDKLFIELEDLKMNLVAELRKKNPYTDSENEYERGQFFGYDYAIDELEKLLKEKEFITRHAKNLAKEIDKKVIDELLKVKK